MDNKHETEIDRLCHNAEEARYALIAAKTALDNCEWRNDQAVEAVREYNEQHKFDLSSKCQCNFCLYCGKEK